jgi:hypothetical protein
MPCGIDHLRIGNRDIWPHGGNPVAFDQHVSPLEISKCAVERERAAALDQQRAAGSGGGRRLLRLRGQARLNEIKAQVRRV